jgi:tetratricopeptide (TPR) repeat protein
MQNIKNKAYIYLLVLVVFGFTLYSNTLGHKFVWDDEFLILGNNFIKDWHYFPRLFTSELRIFSHDFSNYYRPLQSLSYMWDYSVWRLDPFGYHLSNILLHLLVALLVFKLIHLIAKDYRIALLTSVLFVVHPLHTEVNSYISGRADSLVALFLLGSFILYIRQRAISAGKPARSAWFIFSAALFVLALLSKEIALVYPFILFFYEFAVKKERRPAVYVRQSVFFIICAVYIALRVTKLNFLAAHGAATFPVTTTLISRFLTSANIILLYLKLLIAPFDLHLMRAVPSVAGIFTLAALLPLFFLCVLGAGLVLAYRSSRVIFFYYVWSLIFLLPTLNLFPIGVSVAEHFLYVPSIGLFAIAGTFLVNAMDSRRFSVDHAKKNILIIFICAGIAYFAFLTYRQNEVWKDNFSFYAYTLRHAPGDHVLHNNLGNEYLKYGRYDEAETEFQTALHIKPHYAYAYNNLGNLYLLKKLPEKAVLFYKKALELRPDVVGTRDNLGKAYLELGKFEEAISEFKAALGINPGYVQSYLNLGSAYYSLGIVSTAIEYYKKAIAMDKACIPAYYNLGNIFYDAGDFSSAYHWWHTAIEISPKNELLKSALEKLRRE